VVAEIASDVHALARDVFWLQLSALNLRGGNPLKSVYGAPLSNWSCRTADNWTLL
jgi:hypothetical protein